MRSIRNPYLNYFDDDDDDIIDKEEEEEVKEENNLKEEKEENNFKEKKKKMKNFKNNKMYIEIYPEKKEEYYSIQSINFERIKKTVWFQHYYQPRKEQELLELITKSDNNNKNYEEYKEIETMGKETQIKTNFIETIPIENNLLEYRVEYDLIRMFKKHISIDEVEFRNTFQRDLFSVMNDYRDLYFPLRNYEIENLVIETYTLHVINHLLKFFYKI
jgi:hypothetical protein